MAKNPMQRKAQNSFFLGMLITLLITGAIIAFLILQLTKITTEQKKTQSLLKQVYVVSQEVIESGEPITSDKLTMKTVDASTIPSNALTEAELDEKINIRDEEGNVVKKVEVFSKIKLMQGTVITTDMVAETKEIADDLRKQEYNMFVIPSQLTTGQYVDVRLRLPSGKDYIVLSHKRITIPDYEGTLSTNTVSLELGEVEILTLSCAIVEAYKISGSLLYVNQYVEPGLQTAAAITYIPDGETLELISRDPNCVAEAANALISWNNGKQGEEGKNRAAVRNPINNALNENAENATDNAVNALKEELQKAQEERQKYLESLGGTY